MIFNHVIHSLLEDRINKAYARYGPFTSTHEAMGVALEEWDELRLAIKSNDLKSVEDECIDLASVLIRLAGMMRESGYSHERSGK